MELRVHLRSKLLTNEIDGRCLDIFVSVMESTPPKLRPAQLLGTRIRKEPQLLQPFLALLAEGL